MQIKQKNIPTKWDPKTFLFVFQNIPKKQKRKYEKKYKSPHIWQASNFKILTSSWKTQLEDGWLKTTFGTKTAKSMGGFWTHASNLRPGDGASWWHLGDRWLQSTCWRNYPVRVVSSGLWVEHDFIATALCDLFRRKMSISLPPCSIKLFGQPVSLYLTESKTLHAMSVRTILNHLNVDCHVTFVFVEGFWTTTDVFKYYMY